jgi:hypothetical protein
MMQKKKVARGVNQGIGGKYFGNERQPASAKPLDWLMDNNCPVDCIVQSTTHFSFYSLLPFSLLLLLFSF